LNARSGDHPRVEVLKCGINGYFAESERILLERYGLRYAPDVVVVGFVPNDVLDTYRGLAALRVSKEGYLTSQEGAELGERGVWWYVHSHLARIGLRAYIDSTRKPLPDDWWKDLYGPSETYAKSWEELFAQYDAMLESTRKAGARFVVLHIPNSRPNAIHAYPGGRMAEWCARRGVLFVDALPALLDAGERAKTYWDEDPHCTPAGYQVIGQALFEALTESGVVR
jgi:hypothetical protein